MLSRNLFRKFEYYRFWRFFCYFSGDFVVPAYSNVDFSLSYLSCGFSSVLSVAALNVCTFRFFVRLLSMLSLMWLWHFFVFEFIIQVCLKFGVVSRYLTCVTIVSFEIYSKLPMYTNIYDMVSVKGDIFLAMYVMYAIHSKLMLEFFTLLKYKFFQHFTYI